MIIFKDLNPFPWKLLTTHFLFQINLNFSVKQFSKKINKKYFFMFFKMFSIFLYFFSSENSVV